MGTPSSGGHFKRLLLLLVVGACASSLVAGLPISTLLAFKNSISNPSKLSSWNASLHVCEWHGVVCEQADVLEISVDLRGLGLQGMLSQQWGGITNLVSIDLADNELFGQLPASWANLKRLRALSLERNMLTLNVTEVHAMLPALEHLDLSGNVLIKPDLPSDLSQQSHLSFSQERSGTASSIVSDGPMTSVKSAWNRLVDSRNRAAAAAQPPQRPHRARTHYDSARSLIEAEMPLNATIGGEDDVNGTLANATVLLPPAKRHGTPPPPASLDDPGADVSPAAIWDIPKIPTLDKTTGDVINMPDVKAMAPEPVTTVMLSAVDLAGAGATQFRAPNAQAMANVVASSTGLQVLVMTAANVSLIVRLAGYTWGSEVHKAVVDAYAQLTGYPEDLISARLVQTGGLRRRLRQAAGGVPIDINVQLSGMSVDNATRLAKYVNTSCTSSSICTITLSNELVVQNVPSTGSAGVVGSSGAAVTTQVSITIALTQKDVEQSKPSVIQQSLSSQSTVDSLLQSSGLSRSSYQATINTPPTSVAITTLDTAADSGPSTTLKVLVGVLAGVAGVGLLAAVVMYIKTRRRDDDSNDEEEGGYRGGSFNSSGAGRSGKKGKKGKKKVQVPVDRRPLQHEVLDVTAPALVKQQQERAQQKALALVASDADLDIDQGSGGKHEGL